VYVQILQWAQRALAAGEAEALILDRARGIADTAFPREVQVHRLI
jgi:hypothetical protein